MTKILTFCMGDLRTNTYFIFDETGACAVIDPGMDGRGIWEKLCSKGLRPTHVLLTHGHFDHSLGAKELVSLSGAKLYCHKEDALLLSDPWKNGAAFFYRGDIEFYPRTEADVLFEDGDVIDLGSFSFTVMHTPGHTPGSVCFRLDNNLFCGDTVFAYGFGRYDLWGGDREKLCLSLEKLASLENGIKLCPGHGNTASLDRIREQILLDAASLK